MAGWKGGWRRSVVPGTVPNKPRKADAKLPNTWPCRASTARSYCAVTSFAEELSHSESAVSEWVGAEIDDRPSGNRP